MSIIQSITCDNKLFERRQEKQFDWGNANYTMNITSLALEKNALGPEPM